VTSKDPGQFLPTSVQKSYFMLSRSARAVLDTVLRKYRPGRTDLIPVGGIAQLKPALRLMTAYRLMIQEVTGADVMTSYTRWLECVRKGRHGAGSLRSVQPALRSQYSLRLYSWAKKHVEGEAQTSNYFWDAVPLG
jgi:hypothetical protein